MVATHKVVLLATLTLLVLGASFLVRDTNNNFEFSDENAKDLFGVQESQDDSNQEIARSYQPVLTAAPYPSGVTLGSYESCMKPSHSRDLKLYQYTTEPAVIAWNDCHKSTVQCQNYYSQITKGSIKSTSTLPPDFYDCSRICASKVSVQNYFGNGRFYFQHFLNRHIKCTKDSGIYGGVSKTMPVSQNYGDYQNYMKNNCKGLKPTCATGDTVCSNYNTCIASTTNSCKSWNEQKSGLSVYQPLPEPFFTCFKSCNPSATSNAMTNSNLDTWINCNNQASKNVDLLVG